MGLLNKLGIGTGASASRKVSHHAPASSAGSGQRGKTAPPVAAGAHKAPHASESNRVSNGLKEFLWNLDGLGRGTMLDLGPAWQTTLSFFIERGFRVTSDDLLRSWKEFMKEEEAKAKENPTPESYAERTPEV